MKDPSKGLSRIPLRSRVYRGLGLRGLRFRGFGFRGLGV